MVRDWLRAHAPHLNAYVRSGASPSDIATFERAIGRGLPPELRELWALFDGEIAESTGVIGGGLWSLRQALEAWQDTERLASAGEFDDRKARPAIGVKKKWWSSAWVPFAGMPFDVLCVDTDPDSRGAPGQIVRFMFDDGERPIVASGVAEWLHGFANDLEAGRYRITATGLVALDSAASDAELDAAWDVQSGVFDRAAPPSAISPRGASTPVATVDVAAVPTLVKELGLRPSTREYLERDGILLIADIHFLAPVKLRALPADIRAEIQRAMAEIGETWIAGDVE